MPPRRDDTVTTDDARTPPVPPGFDDDRWNTDDTYAAVKEFCLGDDAAYDDDSAECWSKYHCAWLHKLDANYKCVYDDPAGKETTYCCANSEDLCCEPDPTRASIAACTLFAIICILLKLVMKYGKKDGGKHKKATVHHKHQDFQILTQHSVAQDRGTLNDVLKDHVMSTGFD